MKKILIPIDFKFNSYDAIDYAVNLFKREQCEFYFFNTYTYNLDGFNAIHLLQAEDEWFEKPRRDSEKKLGKVIQKYAFKYRSEKHRFNAISQYTNLIEGIKNAIQDIKIDLVVLSGKNNINEGNEKYSKNTKLIIEKIRECPLMIIPSSAKLNKDPKFVLVSSFELDVPTAELENWYDLVKIANGSVKLVSLSKKDKITSAQKTNLNKVLFYIEMHSENPVTVDYIETAPDLKHFVKHHSDYIICLIDRKPDFLRKLGLNHSRITKLGPLPSTPLMALHR